MNNVLEFFHGLIVQNWMISTFRLRSSANLGTPPVVLAKLEKFALPNLTRLGLDWLGWLGWPRLQKQESL